MEEAAIPAIETAMRRLHSGAKNGAPTPAGTVGMRPIWTGTTEMIGEAPTLRAGPGLLHQIDIKVANVTGETPAICPTTGALTPVSSSYWPRRPARRWCRPGAWPRSPAARVQDPCACASWETRKTWAWRRGSGIPIWALIFAGKEIGRMEGMEGKFMMVVVSK